MFTFLAKMCYSCKTPSKTNFADIVHALEAELLELKIELPQDNNECNTVSNNLPVVQCKSKLCGKAFVPVKNCKLLSCKTNVPQLINITPVSGFFPFSISVCSKILPGYPIRSKFDKLRFDNARMLRLEAKWF